MESRSVLRLIRYHWVAVLICAQLGLMAGAAVAITAPREYTASADVFVQVTGGSSTSDVASTTNFSQQQARNFSAVADREVVLAPVIDELGLDMTVAQLRGRVSTVVPLNSTMITISVTADTPQSAAEIANQVATSLTEVVPDLTPEVFGESPVRLQVIETATPPARPSSPNVPLYLFFGLLAGLVAGAVLVVIRGVVGTRLSSPEQATEITGAPVIGTIVFDRHASREPIPLFGDSWSLRAEEYRQLRASLRFLQAGEASKVFVVTSSVPGEGKSTTAANIAVALAASGVRVGLVEADLRRPTLGDVLDVTTLDGLSSVLAGDTGLDDALQPWGDDGLKILLAGDVPPNPSELLESPRAREVFDEIRSRFDITIIDSPPLTAVADAAVLARHLGSAILVVGARRVKIRELRHAVDRLVRVGASIEGVVLNFASVPRSSRYNYGYAAARGSRRAAAASPSAGTDAPTDESPDASSDAVRESTTAFDLHAKTDLGLVAETTLRDDHDRSDGADTGGDVTAPHPASEELEPSRELVPGSGTSSPHVPERAP